MKQWKKTLGIAVSLAGILIVGATFFSVASASSDGTVEIRLAHNQAAGSEIADSIAKISEFAAEDPSQGRPAKTGKDRQRPVKTSKDQ